MEQTTTETGLLEPPVPRKALAAAAMICLAVHAVLWWLYYGPGPKRLWGDEILYMDSAVRLLAGNPGWHPEALWPALAPRFAAGVFGIFGISIVWLQIVQTLLLGLTAIVLADLARRLSGSATAGFVVAVLTFGFPPLAAFAHYLWPEVLHLFLWVAVLWLLVARGTSWRWLSVAGASLGLALLTKSVLLPFVPVLLVAVLVFNGWRRGLGPCIAMLIAVALTVAPTVINNTRRLGVPMISDSSAFNLWVGLNDSGRRNFEREYAPRAYVQYMEGGETVSERNQAQRRRIKTFFAEHRVVDVLRAQAGRQYFRLFDRSTYLSEQLPGGAAARVDAGYLGPRSVITGTIRIVSFVAYGVVLLMAPLGFAVWRFRRPGWARVLLLFVAYNLAIFFWLHVKSRYRIQFLPVFFVGCGVLVAWLRCRLAGIETAPVRKWLWMAALAAAAATLLFAFAP